MYGGSWHSLWNGDVAIFDRICYILCMTFMNSPFPYAGCKFNLLEQLDPYIPSGERLFDVFGGSAVVGVNMSKKFNFVCITDILGDLISMHRSLQTDNPDDIISKLKDLSSKDPEKYAELRNDYNALDKDSPERGYRLYGLILSCTNNLMRFNQKGGFNQTCGKRQLTAPKEAEIRAWCGMLQSEQGSRIKFGHGSFDVVMQRIADRIPPEGTVIYLDPPYSNTEAGYNSTWTVEQDNRLSGFMLAHPEYKYILSSCSKDGKTTVLVETLRNSGQYDVHEVPHVYKAAKKSKSSDTMELILVSR